MVFNINKIYLTFILGILVLVSCLPIRTKSLGKETALPPSFPAQTDTNNIGLLKRNMFFQDTLLIQLIDSALVNNYNLQITLQRINTAKAYYRFHFGKLFPTVDVNIATSVNKYGEYTNDGVGNFDTRLSTNLSEKQMIPNPVTDYYGGMYSSWEIDVWGKLRNQKKAAKARYMSNQVAYHLVITNLIAEIAATYYELVFLDYKIEIVNQGIELQKRELKIVNIQKQAGRVTELAVKQFEAQLMNSLNRKIELAQERNESESKLNLLLGRYPQKINREVLENCSLSTFSSNAGIPSQLLIQRPDIKQAELELYATNADVLSARAAFFPSFSITAGIGLQSFNQLLLFNIPASVAANTIGNITAPLLNRNVLKLDYANAKSSQKEAYLNYQYTVIKSYHEVYNHISKIENLSMMITHKQAEIDALNKVVESWSDLFTSGRASYLEILSAQNRMLQTRQELADTRLYQIHSYISLYKSLGGGWE